MTDTASTTVVDPQSRSAGALIRESREAQGISLASLAMSLKVPQRKLEALEGDRWDELKDLTFARALAQTVCRFLKLDSAPVMAGMPGAVAHSLGGWGEGINAPFRDRLDRSSVGWLAAFGKPFVWGPALIALITAVIYWAPPAWLSFGETSLSKEAPDGAIPATHSAQTSESIVLQPVPVVVPAPLSASGVATGAASSPSADPATDAAAIPASGANSSALPRAPVGSTTAAVSSAVTASAPVLQSGAAVVGAPAEAGRIVGSGATTKPPLGEVKGVSRLDTVVLAEQPSWVLVKDAGGEVLLSRLVQPGERVNVSGTAPLQVVVGNAAAVKLWVRGQPLDLGPSTRENVARLELK